jgi:glycosyltransferase involved in cell wall biosynthesis
LATALTELAADEELRARLGAAARDRARRLNAEEVTGRLEAIYAELL